MLALLLRFPQLRDPGLAVPEELLWESANREILMAWKRSPKAESVGDALPEELKGNLERLTNSRLPELPAGQAEEALQDCLARLERRQIEAERREIGSLLATKEEELGATVLAEAAASGTEAEPLKEAVSLAQRDVETGLKLHMKGRKDGDGDTAETTVNG